MFPKIDHPPWITSVRFLKISQIRRELLKIWSDMYQESLPKSSKDTGDKPMV